MLSYEVLVNTALELHKFCFDVLNDLLAHCPWVPEFAAMPIMACSFMEKGPGLRENEKRPRGTV